MPNDEKGISNKGYSLIRAYHQIMQNEKESVFVIRITWYLSGRYSKSSRA